MYCQFNSPKLSLDCFLSIIIHNSFVQISSCFNSYTKFILLFLWLDHSSIFMTYSFPGSSHNLQTPPLAIILFGQDLQYLRLSDGIWPTAHFLHLSPNINISSAWQCKQEFLSPLGNSPSSQVWHWPSLLTISFRRFGHTSHLLRSEL